VKNPDRRIIEDFVIIGVIAAIVFVVIVVTNR
jgi:hypothetical protein